MISESASPDGWCPSTPCIEDINHLMASYVCYFKQTHDNLIIIIVVVIAEYKYLLGVAEIKFYENTGVTDSEVIVSIYK